MLIADGFFGIILDWVANCYAENLLGDVSRGDAEAAEGGSQRR